MLASHLMISTFSLFNSRTIFLTRWPRRPTQAPTGSTLEARLAGDALDFNGAVVDFGDFQLKEFDDKLGVGPRKDDFRPMHAGFDGLDVAADALADLVFLRGNAFAVRQERLVFAQVNGHVRPLEAADDPAENVPNPVFE